MIEESSREKQVSPKAVYLVLLSVQISFSGFHTFGKYVIGQMPPLALAGIRCLFAVPILLALAYAFDRIIPARKEWPHLALIGFLGVFANQILFILGLNYTTATNVAVFMPSIPVFTVAVAILFKIEKATPGKIAGVLLAVFGALVMLDFTKISFGHGKFFGNLLILANSFSYALYLVLQRPILKRLPPMTVVAWSYLFGGGALVLVVSPILWTFDFSNVGTIAWVGVAYIVLLPTTYSYAANSWAIQHSSPSLSALFTTMQPVATAILAAIFLGESFGVRQVAGFVLILAGLAAVNWKKTPRQNEPLLGS